MALPILIDCDPGHDDAVALLLAFASPELHVLGVTVTHGNVPLERTVHNALVIRDVAGSRVPVYRGAARPLVREALHAAHVHGQSGLGDVPLPTPTGSAEDVRAAEFMVNTVLAHPGEVTLVATGPLTNVALALRLEERFARALRGIVLMGGSADWGNVTPAAEFNFYADPHAARVVFEAGVPVTMFGLNVTRQVPVTDERVQQLHACGTHAGRVAGDLLADYLMRLERRRSRRVGALHDPCTIAFLLQPQLFEVQDMFVQINAEEGLDFGRSLCDVTSVTNHPANARVGMRADADGVYALLAQRLAHLP